MWGNTLMTMAGGREWTIEAGTAGVRLDKYLAAPERLGSRARAVAALERGKIYLNGSEVGLTHAATRLAAGDVVRLWMDRPGSARARREGVQAVADLQIVFEDEALLRVNKPPRPLTGPLARKSGAPAGDEARGGPLRPVRQR